MKKFPIITDYTSLKKLYLSEIRSEIGRHNDSASSLITEKDIAFLPESVQNYFRRCGYVGRIKMKNAEIIWKDVLFKMSPKSRWIKADCRQFNSVPEPARIVYMKSRIMGVIPFEGRDKYQDSRGNMLIKAMNFFTLADAKGKEMDASALVTVLAEAFLVPSYALQNYITWSVVDPYVINAVLKHNDTAVSGNFYFNRRCEFVRFETFDRYYSERGADYKKMKWSVTADHYVQKDGIRFPTALSAAWNTADGTFEYFKGVMDYIRFDKNG